MDQFVELWFDRICFLATPESSQAFVVTMQGPDIARVLVASRQATVDTEVVLVVNQGFFDSALF
ncbi:MAG: hypothetical protein GY785_14880 [Gammaproteobacteria bacterium]|nr:hypothetical protein [Gammaproteobacteria bacterium]